MKHLPIETWFCEMGCSEIQSQDMRAHLETCVHCRESYLAWQEVKEQIKRLPLLAPPPAFSNRWESYARAQMQRSFQATWKWIGFVVGLGLLVLVGCIALLVLLWDSNFVAEGIAHLIRLLTRLPSTWLHIRYAAVFWLRETPLYWLPAIGFILYAWILLPLSAWFYTLAKLTLQGAKTL